MHTISIFVDQNRMPKLASYFECQTHLAKNLRNSANFIIRNLRTGLKKDPIDRTSNENEVIETVRIGIEMANEKLQKDVVERIFPAMARASSSLSFSGASTSESSRISPSFSTRRTSVFTNSLSCPSGKEAPGYRAAASS